jgi:hypothetical protein
VRLFLAAAVALLAAAAAGCQSNDATSGAGGGLIPMPVNGTRVDETFTGTVAVGSSDLHNFNVAVSGTVNITLTAAGPPPTISMGLGVGNPSTSNGSPVCTLLSGGVVNATASTAAQLSGTVVAGAYCVAVFDNGSGQAAAVTYTVVVSHT